jgi:predicted dehydrogenase
MTRAGRAPVRLALIGTGGMGGAQAAEFRKDPRCRLVAAVDVDRTRAEAFGLKHGVPAFTDAREMLAKVPCDAVTIVTTDTFHAPLSILCLKAGRHVLCEKPLALSHREALTMVAAARRSGRVNGINFAYRNWPAIHGMAKVVRKGGIGELRHVEGSYLQAWLSSLQWGDWRKIPPLLWRLSKRHGSKGALGDIGVHLIDFVTYPAGPIARVSCRTTSFRKAPRDRIGQYVLDAGDSAVITAEFANGALGALHTTRWSGGSPNRLFLRISGTLGTVEMDSDRSTDTFRISAGKNLHKAAWAEVKSPPVRNIYQRFISAVMREEAFEPDFARGAEVQAVLDACHESDRLGRPVRVRGT